ncbi:MAG: hypothetical protein BWZ08_00173 [candidate division BRC1 bacterium ADurb.BinA292]|nr:MAG: hypothetical protein BWZ08_00173 [candidate division BRC1 bacterium ADurb.BinA292]
MLAALFGLLLVGLMVQFFQLIEAGGDMVGAHALPIPAVVVVLGLVVLTGAAWRLLRVRLLGRGELIALFFVLMMAVPLMSSGFWSYMIGAIGAIPKTADFDAYDAYPKKLWPHGRNLLAGALTPARRADLVTSGTVLWETIELEHAPSEERPVLVNQSPEDVSWVRMRVALAAPAGAGDPFHQLIPEEPYLVTLLLRPHELGPEAQYACRLYYDDRAEFGAEAFAARMAGEVSYLHPLGFLRRGMYGLTVPRDVQRHVDLELALEGRGRLELADVELISVGALHSIYYGREVINASRFAELGESPRTELLVRPDNLWSVAGLRFLLAGYIPWREWLAPIVAWSGIALLVLLGTFCLAVLMRSQWIESERYPLPLTRIPTAIVGEPDAPPSDHALAPIWRNRLMWLGFAVTLFWCLMKGWHQFNTSVPDMRIAVELTPYFTDPGWGNMWRGQEVRNVTFAVFAFYVGIAIFIESSVLLSLIVGFFLFRCQYWFGEATGLALTAEYPFVFQQQVGAFLTYGVLILFFTRKHLARVVSAAVRGRKEAWRGEALSYPAALAGIAVSVGGIALWAWWVGLAVPAMLVFFAALLLIGLVSAKIRAECGTPMGIFMPVALSKLVAIAGGMEFFGPAGVLFVSFANWIIFRHLFFLIPGMQVELLELGRRYRLPPRAITGAALLGVVGGIFLGGWIFLSLGYAIGGDNFTHRYPYMDKGHLVNEYNLELAKVNPAMPAPDTGIDPPTWGYVFAAGVTFVLTVLRQIFSGFWFHPVGFVVSSMPMLEYVWGSLLVAWAIRVVTLKLGGAVTVRTRLMPFFIGVFLAAVAAYAIFGAINTYLYFFHPTLVRARLLF